MMLSGVIGSHSLGTTSATLPVIAAHWSVPSIGRILPPRFALSVQSFTPARLHIVGSVRKNGKDIAETGRNSQTRVGDILALTPVGHVDDVLVRPPAERGWEEAAGEEAHHLGAALPRRCLVASQGICASGIRQRPGSKAGRKGRGVLSYNCSRGRCRRCRT